MNTQSISSANSPFRFLTQKFNRSNRGRESEIPSFEGLKPDNKPSALSGNPQKIIENQIVNTLEKATGTNRILSARTDDNDLSPENVAGRILAFVNQSYGQLKNSDPNFDEAEFFGQIKQAVETGFNEARDALDKQGLLQGPLKDNLDATYTAIQNGLTQLQTGGSRTDAAPAAQVQGFSAQLNRSAEIEIVTKEGDRIKVSLQQSASAAQGVAKISQNGLTAGTVQSSFENSSDFSVTIDGDLNDNEQQALKKLLNQMDKVGQKFFNGNVQKAFQHAQKIGLDSEQIASFSMSLSMEKSIQAISAYQQAAVPDQPVEPEKIRQAADFFSQAKELLKTAQSALEPFADPLQVFNALFGAVDLAGLPNNAAVKPEDAPASLQQIIKPLGEAVLAGEKTAQA